jgi:hypothetical protein
MTFPDHSTGSPAARPDSGAQEPLTRTRLAAVCLLAGAVLTAVTAVLDPAVPDDTLEGLLTYTATEPERWTAWALALTATGLVLLPAIAALGRAVTGRGAGLTLTGACMAGAGAVGMVVLGASETTLTALTAGTTPVTAETVAAAERLEEAPGLAVAFILLLLGWYVGLRVLLWGLWRARRVALWVPVLGTLGGVGAWFASAWPNPWEGAFTLLTALALAGCAPVLLRRSATPGLASTAAAPTAAAGTALSAAPVR